MIETQTGRVKDRKDSLYDQRVLFGDMASGGALTVPHPTAGDETGAVNIADEIRRHKESFRKTVIFAGFNIALFCIVGMYLDFCQHGYSLFVRALYPVFMFSCIAALISVHSIEVQANNIKGMERKAESKHYDDNE